VNAYGLPLLPIVKGELDLHYDALSRVWNKTRSVDTAT